MNAGSLPFLSGQGDSSRVLALEGANRGRCLGQHLFAEATIVLPVGGTSFHGCDMRKTLVILDDGDSTCSGQVIGLLTAVTVLVGNAVDAGASAVPIQLEDYGSVVIEVPYNGSGVDVVYHQQYLFLGCFEDYKLSHAFI